jgi:hypothetical protein
MPFVSPIPAYKWLKTGAEVEPTLLAPQLFYALDWVAIRFYGCYFYMGENAMLQEKGYLLPFVVSQSKKCCIGISNCISSRDFRSVYMYYSMAMCSTL